MTFVMDRGMSIRTAAALTGLSQPRRPSRHYLVWKIRVFSRLCALMGRRMAQIDRYTCEETIRRLDDYLDRELTPHEVQLVQEHLEVCALCASEYAFEARALERLRDKLQRIPAPADLLARVS